MVSKVHEDPKAKMVPTGSQGLLVLLAQKATLVQQVHEDLLATWAHVAPRVIRETLAPLVSQVQLATVVLRGFLATLVLQARLASEALLESRVTLVRSVRPVAWD
jgi:hypothetical protein